MHLVERCSVDPHSYSESKHVQEQQSPPSNPQIGLLVFMSHYLCLFWIVPMYILFLNFIIII